MEVEISHVGRPGGFFKGVLKIPKVLKIFLEGLRFFQVEVVETFSWWLRLLFGGLNFFKG